LSRHGTLVGSTRVATRGGRCEYCQVAQEFDRLTFEIDHVIAESHGGPTNDANLCLACFACNRHKGPNLSGLDPLTGKIVPLYDPRRQDWTRHFHWNGPRLVGRTAAGRATVAALRINVDYRVTFRRGLIVEGVFPPRK
jgi:hypothetical protein